MRRDRFHVMFADSVCYPAAPRNTFQAHHIIKELEWNQAGEVLISKRVSVVMRYNSATGPMKPRGLSGSAIALAQDALQVCFWEYRSAASPMTTHPRLGSGVFAGSTAAPPGTARRVWLPVCRPPARSNCATCPPQHGQRKITAGVNEHTRKPKRNWRATPASSLRAFIETFFEVCEFLVLREDHRQK